MSEHKKKKGSPVGRGEERLPEGTGLSGNAGMRREESTRSVEAEGCPESRAHGAASMARIHLL